MRMSVSCRVYLILLLIAVVALPLSGGAGQSDVIAIVGATVVDGTGSEPRPATVIIRGERIAAVGAEIKLPPGARVIQAQGQTLLPGLFDLHTHLPYSTASVSGDWPKNVEAYLYAGVTSVVDFGSYPEMFAPMRELIASGRVAAPRISLAARITTPGGHGGEGGRGDFFSLEVQTPREARAAIQRVLPYRPDVIKVFTDGWRYGTDPDLTSMNEQTLTALVDEAHKHGLRVLTHTVSLEKAKIASRAAVDVVDHGVGNADVDDELIRLMKEKGTTYVSTMAVYEPRQPDFSSPMVAAVVEPAVRQGLQARAERRGARSQVGGSGAESFAEARRQRWARLQHNEAAMRAAGINLGDGTDAGETATFHGWATLHELELMVAAGLTPMEAIRAATYNSAHALGVDGERGSIAVGKLADLVLIEGAPQRDIKEIYRVSRVFLGGREIDRQQIARDIASPDLTPIPAAQAPELLDDFEGATPAASDDAWKSKLGTLWVNSTDPGADHSRMIFGRIARSTGDHAMSVMGHMSVAEHPFVSLNLPLSPGGMLPVDVRGYKGVRFDVRGDGDYRLVVPTRAVRNNNFYQTTFQAGPAWQTVTIDFSNLRPMREGEAQPWTGADVVGLMFRVERGPGDIGWLELDNLRFYR